MPFSKVYSLRKWILRSSTKHSQRPFQLLASIQVNLSFPSTSLWCPHLLTWIFRDPLNGAWCDSLYHPDHPWLDPDVEEFEEMTPCGPDNNFYSSAGAHFTSDYRTCQFWSLHMEWWYYLPHYHISVWYCDGTGGKSKLQFQTKWSRICLVGIGLVKSVSGKNG